MARVKKEPQELPEIKMVMVRRVTNSTEGPICIEIPESELQAYLDVGWELS